MKKNVSLIFTGDIGFDRYMNGKWTDENLLSQDVLDFFASGDHVIANVEGAMVKVNANADPGGKGVFFHAMDPDGRCVLDKIHADIWHLNNNHIMDMGVDGLDSTLAYAKEMGAKTLGVGHDLEESAQPVYLPEAGGIGLVGVGFRPECEEAGENRPGCFPWNQFERIGQAIAEVKSKCRWCIVIPHGGEEFTCLPSPYTRDFYLKYLELGADIVVSHHPHVPMNYEKVGEKIIFYSLGNFLFDTDYQRAQNNTDTGLLLKLNLSEEGFTFEPFGLKLLRGEEHIVKGEIPAIFADVQREDYDKLLPLSVAAFFEAEKKRVKYLNPEKYRDFTEEDWEKWFALPEHEESVRLPDEMMDFPRLNPIAKEAKKGEWKKSGLEEVRNYILKEFE